MPDAFRVDPADTVATLLTDVVAGPVTIGGAALAAPLVAREPIALGHKIAVADMDDGAAVVKFGVTIGFASQAIRRGDWVHLHNCRSGVDTRSGTLDLHTGAATDTRYE
jgi:hypothetical protein